MLRTDYLEWFTDKDGNAVLVNLNVKEKTALDGVEKIIITRNLFSRSGGTIFENVAYFGKRSANIDDYDKVVVDADVDYLNVYTTVENDPNATNGRYSLHDVAGKTLKEIFEGNNAENQVIDIETLRDNYVEWFQEGAQDGPLVLKMLNIKAVNQTTLGIGDNPNIILTTVYPNPVANGIINVMIKKGSSFDYTIYSMTGALMKKGSSKRNSTRIDVSSLRSGVYILKIKNDQGAYSTKFIK